MPSVMYRTPSSEVTPPRMVIVIERSWGPGSSPSERTSSALVPLRGAKRRKAEGQWDVQSWALNASLEPLYQKVLANPLSSLAFVFVLVSLSAFLLALPSACFLFRSSAFWLLQQKGSGLSPLDAYCLQKKPQNLCVLAQELGSYVQNVVQTTLYYTNPTKIRRERFWNTFG